MSRARKIAWVLRDCCSRGCKSGGSLITVETWRVTGEYGLSDVNQKSKSFNWTLRFERDTLPCLLLGILVWKVGSRYEKPWKRKKRKRGDIFPVLGTIIISECISLDNNKRPRSHSSVSYLFTSRRNFSFVLGWNPLIWRSPIKVAITLQ